MAQFSQHPMPLGSINDVLHSIVIGIPPENLQPSRSNDGGGDLLAHLFNLSVVNESRGGRRHPGIVSEVISGKRELNKEQIRRLSERFRVSPEVFF